MVDLVHGRGRPIFRKETCPTITRARGGSCAFWNTKLNRRLTVMELARLQGCDITSLDRRGITDAQFGRMVGNAMTITVVERLIGKMLLAVNL